MRAFEIQILVAVVGDGRVAQPGTGWRTGHHAVFASAVEVPELVAQRIGLGSIAWTNMFDVVNLSHAGAAFGQQSRQRKLTGSG